MQSHTKAQLSELLDSVVNAYKGIFKRPVPKHEYLRVKNTAVNLGLSIGRIELHEAQLDAFIAGPLIAREPSISEFDNSMIPFGKHNGSSQNLKGLRVSLGVGVEQTVDELEKYISREAFVVRQILPIAGVKIEELITLSNGVALELTEGDEEAYKDRLPDYEARFRNNEIRDFYLSPYSA